MTNGTHTTIRIDYKTKARLAKLGRFSETYDDILNMLLDIAEEVVQEGEPIAETVERVEKENIS